MAAPLIAAAAAMAAKPTSGRANGKGPGASRAMGNGIAGSAAAKGPPPYNPGLQVAGATRIAAARQEAADIAAANIAGGGRG